MATAISASVDPESGTDRGVTALIVPISFAEADEPSRTKNLSSSVQPGPVTPCPNPIFRTYSTPPRMKKVEGMLVRNNLSAFAGSFIGVTRFGEFIRLKLNLNGEKLRPLGD